MQRRDLLRGLLAVAATSTLLSVVAPDTGAQEDVQPGPSSPGGESGAGSGSDATPDSTPVPASDTPPPPVPDATNNNIIGLNVARLTQPLYIWATADLANANGGDWGYITVVWTADDREARAAELNLQVFLDRCYEFEVQPIIRVATKFQPKLYPTAVDPMMRPRGPQQTTGVEGVWARPDWDEPQKWREYFEKGRWPNRRVWIVAGNEPNLGREWGGAVDAAGYARYLDHFLDVFEGSDRFRVVNGALDISNTTELPIMQDGMEFLDEMAAAVPRLFSRLPAWASNPYKVTSRGPGVRFTHLAYEAEFDRIGREMPVIITEAGALETGDEQEIARFYADAYKDWAADPKVIAATPLFWHPDRNDYWMFELDRRGAFVHTSPTYELMRKLPRVAGSPNFVPTVTNVARTTPFEATVAEAAPAGLPPALAPSTKPAASAAPCSATATVNDNADPDADEDTSPSSAACDPATADKPAATTGSAPATTDTERTPASSRTGATQGAVAIAGSPPAPEGTEPASRDAPPNPPAPAPSPAAQPPSSTAATTAPAAPARVVVRTGSIGATLRVEPARDADFLTILPDGTLLEMVGEARLADDLVWQRVRTRDGREGWVAADLLVPAEPVRQ